MKSLLGKGRNIQHHPSHMILERFAYDFFKQNYYLGWKCKRTQLKKCKISYISSKKKCKNISHKFKQNHHVDIVGQCEILLFL